MSTLGVHIDAVWNAVHAEVASVTFGGDSINAVKGRGYPIDVNPRVYTMIGPVYMQGGKTGEDIYWIASFLVLVYYDYPTHATREESIRTITEAIIDELEGNRQLGGLVETTETTRIRPMTFPGYERANAQLVVTTRFKWNIPASYTTTGDGLLGTSWNDIITAIGVEVDKVSGLDTIYYSVAENLDNLPACYVILADVDQRPFTTQKSINKLTIDIPIFTKDSDITAGEVLGLVYAGKIVEELGDDFRLGGIIEVVESVQLIPNWAGQNGYERSVMAVKLEVSAIR